MDELDVEILRHSLYVATDPVHAARGMLGPWQIAQRLGVHGTTVKARLAELRTRGILKGVVLAPHLALLGMRVFNYRFRFETPHVKSDALRSISMSQYVYSTRDFIGTDAWVGIVATDEAGAADAARALAANARAETSLVYEARPPPIGIDIKPVDLRILAALAPNAHRDAESVAIDARASARTVRRRLARLSAARAFSVLLNIDVGAMAGAVTIMLETELARGAPSAPVLNAFPDWSFREAARDDLVLLYLTAPDLGRVQELCVRASEIPGVVSVRPRFLLNANIHASAIQAAIERALGAETAMPRAQASSG